MVLFSGKGFCSWLMPSPTYNLRKETRRDAQHAQCACYCVEFKRALYRLGFENKTFDKRQTCSVLFSAVTLRLACCARTAVRCQFPLVCKTSLECQMPRGHLSLQFLPFSHADGWIGDSYPPPNPNFSQSYLLELELPLHPIDVKLSLGMQSWIAE